MCILIVKPKGITIPTKETLETCFKANPDGAGICYNNNNNILIRKGFMNFDAFYKAVQKIPVDSTALIHCRISTSGGVTTGLTHPYPLSNDYDYMKRTNINLKSGSFAVAHNGIFSDVGNRQDTNDTCQFIANYLYPLNNLSGNILTDSLDHIISKLVGYNSKIAIMDTEGNVKRYGNGWIEDGGIYYSNDTYKPRQQYIYYDNNNKWDFNSYVIKNYGSMDKYYEYLDEIELKKIDDLLDKYPDYKDDIYDWYDAGFTPWQIENKIKDEVIKQKKENCVKDDLPWEDELYDDCWGNYYTQSETTTKNK